MQSDISKLCADFLRVNVLSETNEKLKATHARELTASFFGYKSHAALLAEEEYPLHKLEEAAVLVPDTVLMDERRKNLEGLPPNLPKSKMIAQQLISFLNRERFFNGSVWWLSDTFKNYIMEDFLPHHDYEVMDDLSGQMAETNALFDETHYEEAEIHEEDGNIIISVTGQCHGTSDQDRPFNGDQIDMTVTVEMSRIAGRNAYSKPSIRADGAVNWDWADVDEPIPNVSDEGSETDWSDS